MIKKTKLTWWGSILNSALLIAILGILIQQFFFKSNKQVEGRIDLRKEIVKENYQLYNQIIFWTNLNTQWKLSLVIHDKLVLFNEGDSIILDSAKSFPVTIQLEATTVLSILMDSSFRKVWKEYTDNIENSKFKIEPDILTDYNKILKHINEMWSNKDSSVTNLKKLGWVNGDAFNKWIDMNVELRKKIKTYTNLE